MIISLMMDLQYLRIRYIKGMFAPSYVNKVSGAIKFLFCDGASIEVIRYIFRLGTVGTDDEIFNTLGYVVTSSVFTNRVIRLTGLSSILNTTRRWKSSDNMWRLSRMRVNFSGVFG